MSEDVKDPGEAKASPLSKDKANKPTSLTCLSSIRDPYSGEQYKVGEVYDKKVVPESWLDSQVKAGLFK